MGKYNVSIPEFTENLTVIGTMFAELGKTSDGITLFAAAAAVRTGVVTVATTEKGTSAKGITEAANTLNVAKGTVSKGVKVMLARCPELVTCAKGEVRDRVQAFLVSLEAAGETLTSAYESLSVKRDNTPDGDDDQGDAPEGDVAKATALFATAIAYCAKYGFDADELFAAAKGE